jgi:hypothetical protein
MASRWGYEALMVEQFKNNPYTSLYYDDNRIISSDDYQTAYLIPFLEDRLTECLNKRIDTGAMTSAELDEHFSVLKRSFGHHVESTGMPFKDIEKLTSGSFSREVYDSAVAYLASLCDYYNKHNGEANQRKAHKTDSILNLPNGAQILQELKAKYENETIIDIVRNKAAGTNITQEDGELLEKRDPIYNYPKPYFYLDFRTHFLAPFKHFAGAFYETLNFNIVVIWLMTVFLYLALYFKWFKKFLKLFGSGPRR